MEGTDDGTNQKTTERDGTDGNSPRHTEMVRNRWECHGKAGERWRRSEKIRYMTVFPP